MKNSFKVTVSLKADFNFDSNKQKKRYPEEYAKYQELGFEDAAYNTLRIDFDAENEKDADRIYDLLMSGEYGKEYTSYLGIRVNPRVCVFKNNKSIRFAL